jgi:DNA polymerase-3 subunit beta
LQVLQSYAPYKLQDTYLWPQANRKYSYMKFTVSSAELLKRLQLTGGAIGNNPVLPILEDFLFSISGSKLTITASDLDISITTSLEVSADTNGEVAIPARILLDTLKGLPEQPLTFQVNPDTFNIEITSVFGKYKLAGENGSDFPDPPQPDGVDEISVTGMELGHMITHTAFAAGNDEMRLAMMGVYFLIEPDSLTFVATDAHKLVRYRLNHSGQDTSASMILTKKSLNLLKGIVHENASILISFNKSHVYFDAGDFRMSARLIDARYPDYNAVIPTSNPNVLHVSRKDFLSSIRRIALYANKTTNQIMLSMSAGSLNISSQDIDFANEATEQLTCSYEGEPLSIGFNGKYLIEMLNVLEYDEIKMELSTPQRAGLLLPGEQSEGEDILMLVMPVMLGN